MSSGNWMRYLKKIKPYTIKKGFRLILKQLRTEGVLGAPVRADGTGRSALRTMV